MESAVDLSRVGHRDDDGDTQGCLVDHQGLSVGSLRYYKREPLKRDLPLGGAAGGVGLVSSIEDARLYKMKCAK